MYYEPELHFVCDTLRRCGIQVGFTNAESLPERYWSMGPYSLLTDKASFDISVRQTMTQIRENAVYQLTDDFSCRYLYFALPVSDGGVGRNGGPVSDSAGNSRAPNGSYRGSRHLCPAGPAAAEILLRSSCDSAGQPPVCDAGCLF